MAFSYIIPLWLICPPWNLLSRLPTPCLHPFTPNILLSFSDGMCSVTRPTFLSLCLSLSLPLTGPLSCFQASDHTHCSINYKNQKLGSTCEREHADFVFSESTLPHLTHYLLVPFISEVFIFLYSWMLLSRVCLSHFYYPSICWWASRLTPFPGYCG